jgi:hypothetical protein
MSRVRLWWVVGCAALALAACRGGGARAGRTAGGSAASESAASESATSESAARETSPRPIPDAARGDKPTPATVPQLLDAGSYVGRLVEVTGRCLGYGPTVPVLGPPPRTRGPRDLGDRPPPGRLLRHRGCDRRDDAHRPRRR